MNRDYLKFTRTGRKWADNASNIATYRNILPLSPRNSSFIASSQEEFIPNTIIYSAYNVYGYNISKGNANPFILPSENVNWEFILVMLFSFLAIIFTFDAVSGEKEMRTLALGLSNSVSRGVLLIGKLLGHCFHSEPVCFPGYHGEYFNTAHFWSDYYNLFDNCRNWRLSSFIIPFDCLYKRYRSFNICIKLPQQYFTARWINGRG